MELRDYWVCIRTRWISIVVCALAGLIIAAAYTATLPRIYTATATDFIALTTVDSGDDPLNGAQFAAQRVKSYAEIVSSPDVLVPVIDALDLSVTPEQLSGSISVTTPPQTVLLLITATDESADQAAKIANAVALQLGRVIEQLETPANQQVAPVKVTLTQPATAPSSPSSPRRTVNLALGLILGLAAGLAYAFGREALDRTVKSPGQLEDLTEAPLLGQVVYDKDAQENRLSALDTKSARSEGFRTLRANLQFVHVDSPLRSLVVTSPTPGDGKSTVACNLAIAMAHVGKSVCLVEADLRKPRMSEYMGVEAGVGLTDVLAGQRSLKDVLVEWNRGLLDLLPPGQLPPNPSEILASNQMASLVAQLREKYDMVIIDSAPLLAVADAVLVGRNTDGIILVVRHGKTVRDNVTHAVDAIRHGGEGILGTVLNAVPTGSRYGYGYGYGSGYGYGTDKVDEPAAQAGDNR